MGGGHFGLRHLLNNIVLWVVMMVEQSLEAIRKTCSPAGIIINIARERCIT